MLAPAGESLLHHARSMLASVEKMGAELDEYRMGIRGHVRMLANVSAIVEFLPDDLPAFFAMHHLVKIHLEEKTECRCRQGRRGRVWRSRHLCVHDR